MQEKPLRKVKKILKRYKDTKGMLINVLQDVQAEFNYLPEDALNLVAKKFDISQKQISGVTTFYHSLSLTPRGKHIIKVCVGTTCHLKGCDNVMSEFIRTLGVREGETTEDGKYTLEAAKCLGTCAMAPVTVNDDTYFGHVVPNKVEEILANQ